MVDTLPTSDARQDITLFILSIFGNNNGNGLTDRLCGSVAEDSLGAPVPAGDYAVEVLAYDRVVAQFDDGRQPTQPLLSFPKGIFDLLAVGNIAIDFERGSSSNCIRLSTMTPRPSFQRWCSSPDH